MRVSSPSHIYENTFPKDTYMRICAVYCSTLRVGVVDSRMLIYHLSTYENSPIIKGLYYVYTRKFQYSWIFISLICG